MYVSPTLCVGEEVDFAAYADPHLAATTLKMFLRELPEPLLCFDTNSKISHLRCNGFCFPECLINPNQLFPLFIIVAASEESRTEKCREIVESLPPLNYSVLHYLFTFIRKVSMILSTSLHYLTAM